MSSLCADPGVSPCFRPFAETHASSPHSVLGAAIGSAPTLAMAQLPYLQNSNYEPKNTAIVMDAHSGEVLYSERADSPRYPASVTKVMTFYLAFEALASGRLHLNDLIVVSPLAAAQPANQTGPEGRRNHHGRERPARHGRPFGQRHGRGRLREDRRHRVRVSPR